MLLFFVNLRKIAFFSKQICLIPCGMLIYVAQLDPKINVKFFVRRYILGFIKLEKQFL